jgi:polyisoprenoid-binding protein YceI
MKTLSLFLFAVLAAAPALRAEDVKLTSENTTVKFTGSKKDGKNDGSFKKLDGTLSLDGSDVSKAKVSVTIDINSITTDHKLLTSHLKSPDFFDAKKFPQATFVSKKITGNKNKGYTVTGDLTMHGVTHAVTFPATTTVTDGTTTVSAQFSIKRSDWGINYSLEKVNDEVQLALEVKLKTK